jgi:hypothetical protein
MMTKIDESFNYLIARIFSGIKLKVMNWFVWLATQPLIPKPAGA